MSSPPLDISDGASQWLHDHLQSIEETIRKEAGQIAKSDGRDKVEPRDIADAARLFAPGKQFPDRRDEIDIPFRKRMALSITGVTLVSSILALAFGAIGAVAAYRGSTDFAQGVWDIVKLFAGAIVGSAGASVATNLKRD